MASNEFSLKIPPKMDDVGNYESWKADIMIWRRLTDLDVEKQALVVHLRLEGAARIASGELGETVLGQKDGLDKLIEKLDQLFLKDKSTRQYSAFRECYKVKRENSQSVEEFITRFEQVLFKMNKLEMKLPDAVAAFMLLEASNLSENDSKLVLSGIKEVSLENMKESMIRILGGKFRGGSLPSIAVKEEPTFECSETFYGQSTRYRDSKFRRGAFRGSSRGSYTSRGGKLNTSGDKKTNPLDRNGKPSKCAICGSIYHWARSCPDSQDSLSVQERGKSETDDKNEVHFMLFVGYNDVERNNKLISLVEQCHGCALVDSGCTKTVAGNNWFKNYQENLSEYDRRSIIEQKSNSMFTFGDGKVVDSMKKVIVPCYINNKRSTIETDIVQCDIPLLVLKQ